MSFRDLLGALARNMAQRNLQVPQQNFGNNRPGYHDQSYAQGYVQYGAPTYHQQPGYQNPAAPTFPPPPAPVQNANPAGYAPPTHGQTYPGAAPPPKWAPLQQTPPATATPFQPGYPAANSFSWGNLINADKSPSPLFVRLLDAIFNFGDRTFQPQHTSGLEPAKSALLYDAMGYPLPGNPAKAYLQHAIENRFPMPEASRNETLTIYYSVFSLSFSTPHGAMPVLSREGFRAAILTDSLVNPGSQLGRLNHILARHHAQILDPATNAPFPLSQIPRDAFPSIGDAETQQWQRSKNVELNSQLSGYMGDLMKMQRWLHDTTMAGMSSGVWVDR